MRLCNFNRIKLRDRYKEQDGERQSMTFSYRESNGIQYIFPRGDAKIQISFLS